ncbi:hypothetical protein DAI22_03g242100 [Oryza sativa Japonica Group]|nr:hypothetical protein DAI22_03g242100 [Oryza sativa Japonica Group]
MCSSLQASTLNGVGKHLLLATRSHVFLIEASPLEGRGSGVAEPSFKSSSWPSDHLNPVFLLLLPFISHSLDLELPMILLSPPRRDG